MCMSRSEPFRCVLHLVLCYPFCFLLLHRPLSQQYSPASMLRILKYSTDRFCRCCCVEGKGFMHVQTSPSFWYAALIPVLIALASSLLISHIKHETWNIKYFENIPLSLSSSLSTSLFLSLPLCLTFTTLFTRARGVLSEWSVWPGSHSSRPAICDIRLAIASPLKIEISLKYWNWNWNLASSLWLLAKFQHQRPIGCVSWLAWMLGLAMLSPDVCRVWSVASYGFQFIPCQLLHSL